MPRGRPKKPPGEHAQPISISLGPADMRHLGALMQPGETPSKAIQRVLEWAYIMRVESRVAP